LLNFSEGSSEMVNRCSQQSRGDEWTTAALTSYNHSIRNNSVVRNKRHVTEHNKTEPEWES